jgi:hypothetical protein
MYENWPLMEDYEDYEELEDFEDYEDLENNEEFEEFEDGEGDLFIGNIVGRVARIARRLPWQQLLQGGLSALSREQEAEAEALWEMAYLAELAADTESDYEADHFIGALAGIASSILPSLLGESDLEEYEELDDGFNGEGDPFLPALLPIAKMLLPHAMPLVKRGIRAIGRALREADPSKQSVKVLPIVAAKTVASLAKQAKAGKKLTPKRINTTLASQTKKTLANPQQVAKAITQNQKAARRAVQQTRQGVRATKQVLRKQRLMRAQ